MKLYRRLVDITPQQEMHLQVDHYLEPVELTEEEKHDILQGFINKVYKHDFEVALDPEFNMIVQRYFWDLL